MSDNRNGIDQRESHIWSLRMALFLSSLLCAFLIAALYFQQRKITVQVPPDLSKGALIKPGDYYPSTNYTFAIYIWRQLNEWRISGNVDSPAKLEAFKCYITPSFYDWLEEQQEKKRTSGELERTRYMVPLSPYREESVHGLGAKTFSVTLNLNLIEELAGKEVKNVNIRYPLRVVPDHRSCNKSGLALDGFYQSPTRISDEELQSL